MEEGSDAIDEVLYKLRVAKLILKGALFVYKKYAFVYYVELLFNDKRSHINIHHRFNNNLFATRAESVDAQIIVSLLTRLKAERDQ